MKHLFILNPVAGGKRADPKSVAERIEQIMAPRGEEYVVYETVGPMDAAERVRREAIKGKPLRVYACGGDGTLSECAHGAAGFSNCAVTHYPCGTGNDFIKTFGEDNVRLFFDLEALLDGEARPIDLIDVNGRRCINISSVGLDARVGVDVHKYSRLHGKAAYVVSLLVNLAKGISKRLKVITDEETFEGDMTLVCACNGQYYGGGFHPTRDAVPDDGEFEILVVDKVSLLTLARYISAYSRGDWAKYPEIIHHAVGRRLRIESDEELAINVDGECLRGKTAAMKLVRGAVSFIYPRGFKPQERPLEGAPS